MTNAEKEQVKELCDRAILTFTSTDKVIETLENNEWAEFTLGEGKFIVQLKFYNRGFKKNDKCRKWNKQRIWLRYVFRGKVRTQNKWQNIE